MGKKNKEFFVLRTENMGDYHWFSGTVDQFESRSIVLTDIFFNAHEFQTAEEANAAVAYIGGNWVVTPCTTGMSASLKAVS